MSRAWKELLVLIGAVMLLGALVALGFFIASFEQYTPITVTPITIDAPPDTQFVQIEAYPTPE